jgi:Amt family ammonium transporter
MNMKNLVKFGGRFTAAAIVLIAAATPVLAQTAPAAPPPKLDSGDTAWMLSSTALVLLMTVPGLALFYGGMVRKKNVLATAMQSFAITCLVTVLWAVIGYSLAFDAGNAVIGGLAKLMLNGVGKDTLSGTIPETVFMTFQMTFAIITPALITGAFADRMKFSAMMLFIGLWSLVVYSPICHWVWGGGFLMKSGVLDFAGGTVVHINSGVAGLVCALVLGKRIGYREESAGSASTPARRSPQTARPAWRWRSLRLRRRRPRSLGCSASGCSSASRASLASYPVRSQGSSPSRRRRASSFPAVLSQSAPRPASAAGGQRPSSS